MLQVYLPVAEISVNLLVMLGLGAAIGFLSGMFGVGGGFLLTPLLMFSGIPPAIAVATGANQIVASSVSGGLVQWRRGNIDFRMGWVLIIGGVVGAVAGVLLVGLLSRLGHADVFISLVYVTFLGVIGSLMLVESVSAIRRTRAGLPVSMPIAWSDLENGDRPHFDIQSAPAVVARRGSDPWAAYDRSRQTISGAMRRAVGV